MNTNDVEATNIPPNGGKIERRKRGRPRSILSGRAMAKGADLSLRTGERMARAFRKIYIIDGDDEGWNRIDKIVMADGHRLKIGMWEKMALLPVSLRHQMLDDLERGWTAVDAYGRAVAILLNGYDEVR